MRFATGAERGARVAQIAWETDVEAHKTQRERRVGYTSTNITLELSANRK